MYTDCFNLKIKKGGDNETMNDDFEVYSEESVSEPSFNARCQCGIGSGCGGGGT